MLAFGYTNQDQLSKTNPLFLLVAGRGPVPKAKKIHLSISGPQYLLLGKCDKLTLNRFLIKDCLMNVFLITLLKDFELDILENIFPKTEEQVWRVHQLWSRQGYQYYFEGNWQIHLIELYWKAVIKGDWDLFVIHILHFIMFQCQFLTLARQQFRPKPLIPPVIIIDHFFFFFAGESEILKFQGRSSATGDLNRQHLRNGGGGTSSRRPYFRSMGKTYRIRNGYTVTLECSIENLGTLLQCFLLSSSEHNEPKNYFQCSNGCWKPLQTEASFFKKTTFCIALQQHFQFLFW